MRLPPWLCNSLLFVFTVEPTLARTAQGKLEFEVHWVAYQLQPLAPPEGIPFLEYLEQKFKGQAAYLWQKKQASSGVGNPLRGMVQANVSTMG